MKKSQLPARFDPRPFALKGYSAAGVVPVSQLKRIVPKLFTEEGQFSYELNFKRDRSLLSIEGTFSGDCVLECQRCMGAMYFTTEIEIKLGIIDAEPETDNLPEGVDPLVVEDDISVQEILEDELLLALPIVPLHEPEDCKVKMQKPVDKIEVSTKGEKSSPFDVLKTLKN